MKAFLCRLIGHRPPRCPMCRTRMPADVQYCSDACAWADGTAH